jgi:glycosyltransferase involved in cell wall biosynthesis
MAGRERSSGEPFTFGYIGTHIPAKGVDHLIQAFGRLAGESRLRIWGRDRGVETEGLRALARSLPGNAGERVEWMSEYRNQDIVPDVFNRCDAIVVPSIWVENSPLVIHEAQQARVPVITADYGGMAEYVHHEENGLLFTHRDPRSLARQMQRLADDPELAMWLGSRGYLQSADGDVPDMLDHALAVDEIYTKLLQERMGR